MSRARLLIATLTAVALVTSGAGIIYVALEPTGTNSDTATALTRATAHPVSTAERTADPAANASPPSTADPHLIDAVLAPDAPADGVPAVYHATDAALDSPAFIELAASLTKLDDNIYTGNVTAEDLAALEEIDGLTVAADEELSIDPPIDVADYDWDPVWDTQVSVDQAYPELAGLRNTHNLNGTGQTIAIVDSGVDTKALGLGSGKVTYRKDFSTTTSKCKDGTYKDPVGHGTHVASIAAGSPAGGIQGVAPAAKIVDLRVFNCAGGASTSNLLAALNWIISDKQGANTYKITVVNLSLASTDTPDQSGHDLVSKKVNQLVALGVVVMVAAGNEGNYPDTVHSPGTAQHATTIAATNHTPQYGSFLAPYSSTGPSVDFAAPGSSIVAARSTKLGTSTRTIAMSGTSMAAPFAAGLAALVLQRDAGAAPSGLIIDEASPSGVSGTLIHGVEDSFTASDWFTPGRDDLTGHGTIDPIAIVNGGAAAPAQIASISAVPNSTSRQEWWVKIPASSGPLTISMASSEAFEDDHMPYVLYNHDGNTISNWVPCNIGQSSTSTGCSVHQFTELSHSRYFHIPNSPTHTYLWLRPALPTTLSFTAHGLDSGMEVYTGMRLNQGMDLDLSTATKANAYTLRDSSSPPGTMTLTSSATPGVEVTYPTGSQVVHPVGSGQALHQVTVSRAPTGNLPASARVALYFDDYLIGVISVRLPGAAENPQGAEHFRSQARAIWGEQLWRGEPTAGRIWVTENADNAGATGHLLTTIINSAGGKPYPAFLRNASGAARWEVEDVNQLPVPNASGGGLHLFDVSANANQRMAQNSGDGAVVTFHLTGEYPDEGLYDGAWYVNKRQNINGGDPHLILASPDDFWYLYGVEGLPLSTIPLDGWGSPVLSADGAFVAHMKYIVYGSSIKQGLYWADVDAGNASITRISFLFSANDYIRVVGVTATHVVVERKTKHNSTTAELRVYSVKAKKYTTVATVVPGTTTASLDGTSYGYIKAKTSTSVCYSVTAKKNYTVGSYGSLVAGTHATGNGCQWAIATYRNTPSLPSGTMASQLVKVNRVGAEVVLATSAPALDTYRWAVSRGGEKFATVTAVSLATGDTNGRDDVYVGLHGSPPLTITGNIEMSANHAAPGRTATVSVPGWNEGADTHYQWYRGSSPIPGATSSTYTFTTKDVGATLRVRVHGTKNGFAPTVLWSGSTPKVLKAFKSGKTILAGTNDSGKTLTVSVQGWAPSGTKYTYQWLRDGTPIDGATGKSHTLTPADAGTTVSAIVRPSKSGYAFTEVTSTPRVINQLFVASPVPVVDGDPVVGTTLIADTSGWSPEPVKFTYQWKRDGNSISKATKSTYKLTSADAGKKITVAVKATLLGYTSTTRTSTALQIERVFTTAPKPTISGPAEVGKTLTASRGTWKAAPTSFSYQWNRNGSPIVGANASTYVLDLADEAASVTVTVTANRAGYTSKSTTSSAKTIRRVLTDAPTPVITGTLDLNLTRVAIVGETLNATVGTWGPAPVKIIYQWKRNGKSIPNATNSTYKPTSTDLGKQLTVMVTATKTGYATVVRTSESVDVGRKLTAPAVVDFLVNGAPGDPAAVTTGDTVELLTANWSPAGATFEVSWWVGGFLAATGENYTLTAADIGAAISVRVGLTGYRPAITPVRSGSVG